MYISRRSLGNDEHHGSTKLHIDMTDTVDIMVWAPSLPGENYALWQIFPQAASPLICEFLRATHYGNLSDTEHPIHSQAVYFTPVMFEQLYAMCGIRPFTIRQQIGETIFIPAGCAHQACDAFDMHRNLVASLTLHPGQQTA